MRQIPLDLNPAEPASFDNYVPGSNEEALALLRRLAAGPGGNGAPPWRSASVWLWGEPGSGKTHLAGALASAVGERAILLRPGDDLERFTVARERGDAPQQSAASAHPATARAATVVIVDDCDRLNAARQEATFHLYNRVRADPGASFVATGGQPPLALALRDDLRT
ncbi:MAG: DnaA ATPase domain-containing protein, partial [Gammaproteobacteria bacterium]